MMIKKNEKEWFKLEDRRIMIKSEGKNQNEVEGEETNISYWKLLVKQQQEKDSTLSFSKFLSITGKFMDNLVNRRENAEGLRQILKVLLNISKNDRAAINIVAHKKMLSSLIGILDCKAPSSCKHITLMVLANITQVKKNMLVLAEHPNLLATIMSVGFYNDSSDIREQSIKVIQSMACCPHNQYYMVHVNHEILDRLVELTYDSIDKVRKRALASIQNLAFSKQNRIRITQFKNGILLNAILRLALSDQFEHVRLQAVKALDNIIDPQTFAAAEGYEKLFANLVFISLNDANEGIRLKVHSILSRIVYEKIDASQVSTKEEKNQNNKTTILPPTNLKKPMYKEVEKEASITKIEPIQRYPKEEINIENDCDLSELISQAIEDVVESNNDVYDEQKMDVQNKVEHAISVHDIPKEIEGNEYFSDDSFTVEDASLDSKKEKDKLTPHHNEQALSTSIPIQVTQEDVEQKTSQSLTSKISASSKGQSSTSKISTSSKGQSSTSKISTS